MLRYGVLTEKLRWIDLSGKIEVDWIDLGGGAGK